MSEISAFRHFDSKKVILASIMRQYSFDYPVENGFRELLNGELEHDLLLLAEMQYHFNLRNEKAILIRFKESKNSLAFLAQSALRAGYSCNIFDDSMLVIVN